MSIPFLQSDEALRDLTSDIKIFIAVYLYPRCKLFTIRSHERIPSDQTLNLKDDVQHVNPKQDQKVQMILKETARIFRNVDHDPQPDFQDECLDRFFFRRSRLVLAESNNQNDTQRDKPTNQSESNTAASTVLTGTTTSGAPETLIKEPTAASTNIPSDVFEILIGEHAIASVNDSFDPYEQEYQTRFRKRSLPRRVSLTKAFSSTSIDDEQNAGARFSKRHRRN